MRKIHLQPMIKTRAKPSGGDVAAIVIVLVIILGASVFIAAENFFEYIAYSRAAMRV